MVFDFGRRKDVREFSLTSLKINYDTGVLCLSCVMDVWLGTTFGMCSFLSRLNLMDVI